MRKPSPKVITLAISLLALAILILLASGLSSLDLNSKPLYILPMTPVATQALMPVAEVSENTSLQRILSILIPILVVASIIYLIVSKQARKRALAQLIQIAIILAFVYYLSTRVTQPREIETPGEVALGNGEILDEAVPIEPFEPDSPDWVVYALSFGAALIITLLFLRIWLSYRRRKIAEQVADQIMQSARSALGDLQSGGDLRSIILRCYFEMNQVAFDRKNVQRAQYVTPSEFTHTLQKAGLPQKQVNRLTHLFEAARYGNKTPSRRDEIEAISCLEEVVQALGGEA